MIIIPLIILNNDNDNDDNTILPWGWYWQWPWLKDNDEMPDDCPRALPRRARPVYNNNNINNNHYQYYWMIINNYYLLLDDCPRALPRRARPFSALASPPQPPCLRDHDPSCLRCLCQVGFWSLYKRRSIVGLWDNFETTLRELGDNFGTFETTVGQLCDMFGTT